jgi:hypothetical protein
VGEETLTIHIDTALPLFQLLGVICLNGAAGKWCLGGGRIPIRWEKLDIELRYERQRSYLGLEIQVGRMCHEPNHRYIKNVWGWQDVG